MIISTPDNHFTAAPDCRVKFSCQGRVGGAGSCPTVRAGIVSGAGVQVAGRVAAACPDNHFIAGPDCRVPESGRGRVDDVGSCPTVHGGIVSPAGLERSGVVVSAPNNHFTASPDRRVTVSARWRVGGTGGYPTVCARIVSAASVQKLEVRAIIKNPAPDNHFTASPHHRLLISARRRVGSAGGCPSIIDAV